VVLWREHSFSLFAVERLLADVTSRVYWRTPIITSSSLYLSSDLLLNESLLSFIFDHLPSTTMKKLVFHNTICLTNQLIQKVWSLSFKWKLNWIFFFAPDLKSFKLIQNTPFSFFSLPKDVLFVPISRRTRDWLFKWRMCSLSHGWRYFSLSFYDILRETMKNEEPLNQLFKFWHFIRFCFVLFWLFV
jgi:hypothetical protein